MANPSAAGGGAAIAAAAVVAAAATAAAAANPAAGVAAAVGVVAVGVVTAAIGAPAAAAAAAAAALAAAVLARRRTAPQRAPDPVIAAFAASPQSAASLRQVRDYFTRVGGADFLLAPESWGLLGLDRIHPPHMVDLCTAALNRFAEDLVKTSTTLGRAPLYTTVDGAGAGGSGGGREFVGGWARSTIASRGWFTQEILDVIAELPPGWMAHASHYTIGSRRAVEVAEKLLKLRAAGKLGVFKVRTLPLSLAENSRLADLFTFSQSHLKSVIIVDPGGHAVACFFGSASFGFADHSLREGGSLVLLHPSMLRAHLAQARRPSTISIAPAFSLLAGTPRGGHAALTDSRARILIHHSPPPLAPAPAPARRATVGP